jgi:purine-nucleoside phosphorylase
MIDASAAESPSESPTETPAESAAEMLRTRAGDADQGFEVAIVLGSGWAPAADRIGTTSLELSVAELPGFAPPAVAGHAGRVRVVETGGRRCLVFLGRTHLYEAQGVGPVVHPIRTALAAGVRMVVLTNAAGGLRPEWQRVGDPVLITDHLNLTGDNPLIGPRFVDLTTVYSPALRDLARGVDANLREGVYAALRGPSYETTAEVKMLRTLGADLVGMSTVPEAITARAGGAEVLGISLVTNIAAGITGKPLDHAEVLATGRAAAERMGDLLAAVVQRAA